MPARRTRTQLRAIKGDRKAGETQRRQQRVTAPAVDVVDPPAPLSSPAAAEVWERIAPELASRGLLNAENSDLLHAYAVAAAANREAGDRLLGEGILVPGERGDVKNPAAQIFRDTAATLRQLAAALHIDELGLGKDGRGGDEQDPERLLS